MHYFLINLNLFINVTVVLLTFHIFLHIDTHFLSLSLSLSHTLSPSPHSSYLSPTHTKFHSLSRNISLSLTPFPTSITHSTPLNPPLSLSGGRPDAIFLGGWAKTPGWKMFKSASLVVLFALPWLSMAQTLVPIRTFQNIGRIATAQEIKAWDIDVWPDLKGMSLAQI